MPKFLSEPQASAFRTVGVSFQNPGWLDVDVQVDLHVHGRGGETHLRALGKVLSPLQGTEGVSWSSPSLDG